MEVDRSLIEKKHEKIIKKAVNIMNNLDKDTSVNHSMEHIMCVVDNTEEILKRLPDNIDIDKEVCIVSAYWHDTGRSIQNENHAKISVEILSKELKELKYSKQFIEKCTQAIIYHSDEDKPETIEGKVIKDADKISFIDKNRWKRYIKSKHKSRIIDRLPTYRNKVLCLEESKILYDEKIVDLVKLFYDYTINSVEN